MAWPNVQGVVIEDLIKVLGPGTLLHARLAISAIEDNDTGTNVLLDTIIPLNVPLGDPVETLSPAGIIGEIGTGIGTAGVGGP